jgi:hypothetical protein
MSKKSYGARLRGSVFKIKFRVLAGQFESIQTFPGFVQLLEKIGFKVIQKSIIKTMFEKKLSNDKSLEVNVAISRKNCCINLLQEK